MRLGGIPVSMSISQSSENIWCSLPLVFDRVRVSVCVCVCVCVCGYRHYYRQFGDPVSILKMKRLSHGHCLFLLYSSTEKQTLLSTQEKKLWNWQWWCRRNQSCGSLWSVTIVILLKCTALKCSCIFCLRMLVLLFSFYCCTVHFWNSLIITQQQMHGYILY